MDGLFFFFFLWGFLFSFFLFFSLPLSSDGYAMASYPPEGQARHARLLRGPFPTSFYSTRWFHQYSFFFFRTSFFFSYPSLPYSYYKYCVLAFSFPNPW
jgi:hypothetical protein